MQGVKRGDRISINPMKRAYFFQTTGGVRLVAGEDETTIIPATATDEHLEQINVAINNNHIILGWVEEKAEVPDKDSDIRAMMAEWGRNRLSDWLNVFRSDKGVTRSIKEDKLNKMIEFERIGKNRKSVIKDIEIALDFIGGVSKVEETEREKVEIKLSPVGIVTDEPEKIIEIN